MSDEELERLANAVILLNGGTYGHAGATKLGRGVLTLLERVRKAERPSHPTADHSQRVVTALEEMLAPLSDGTLGTRDVVGRVAALLERAQTAEARVRELEEVPQCSNGCDRPAHREAETYCSGCKSVYENDD